MNRNTRLLIVLAFSVVTAALASLGVYAAVRRIPAVRVEAPSVSVVVAAQPTQMGIRLGKNDVKVIPWPAKNPIAGAFAKTEDVLDRGLIASVVTNEPITESKLAAVGAGAGLPPVIHQGMRAISVKVNEVIGVAGFVVPGARVDVLVTMHQEHDTMSRVVVSNVEVLTAGTRYDQGEAQKDAKPIPTTVVTLMVPPADAERIALAATDGQIILALRNPLDLEPTKTSGISSTVLLAQAPAVQPVVRRVVRQVPPPAEPPPVVTPPPAPPAPRYVETYKGTKRGQELVP